MLCLPMLVQCCCCCGRGGNSGRCGGRRLGRLAADSATAEFYLPITSTPNTTSHTQHPPLPIHPTRVRYYRYIPNEPKRTPCRARANGSVCRTGGVPFYVGICAPSSPPASARPLSFMRGFVGACVTLPSDCCVMCVVTVLVRAGCFLRSSVEFRSSDE